MFACSLKSSLMIALLFVVPVSVSVGQDTEFKRWHYTKNGEVVKFTAKFRGLSEESAVFANRENKLAEIPLASLTRESLEDLVVMHAPAANKNKEQDSELAGVPARQAGLAPDAPPWKKKLSRDLEKAVATIEKAKKDYFKGSEKWNENRVNETKEKFNTGLRSYLIECEIPCEILSVAPPENSGSNGTYETKLSVAGIGDFTLNLQRMRDGFRRTRTIADPNIDIGSKAKLKCYIGFSKSNPYAKSIPFGFSGAMSLSRYEQLNQASRDLKFSPLLGTSISRGKQTYYLVYREFHVE